MMFHFHHCQSPVVIFHGSVFFQTQSKDKPIDYIPFVVLHHVTCAAKWFVNATLFPFHGFKRARMLVDLLQTLQPATQNQVDRMFTW